MADVLATGRTRRQEIEAQVYDARARDVFASWTDDDLRVDGSRPPFANREHVDFLSFALDRVAPLEDKRILEVGCGTGALAVYLALRGATVDAIDVSEENIAVASRRASVNGVAGIATFRAVPVELLDDPDGSYDAVIGNQVLHHFQLEQAMPNLKRMLAPGGAAVFCEPVLFVPEFMRRVRNGGAVTRWFPTRVDTPTERSISVRDMRLIAETFPDARVHPFQLLTRLQNFKELSDRSFARLSRLDRALLRRMPPARRLCRYVVCDLVPSPTFTTAKETLDLW
jgi:2-polyprenyl-3-methyl-5-hydroxy-6-metoxy-1,4-benzoquinol methylase